MDAGDNLAEVHSTRLRSLHTTRRLKKITASERGRATKHRQSISFQNREPQGSKELLSTDGKNSHHA
ncbi:hypothetical protein F2Q68_00020122 [Brassica cretica]|uniref:Uncharacterized protein n=1 Tax=Brassica cretica TaxID=69181 RepID=A0A8S9G7D1_BRACR|nr:hypothetical protein F2Q68_00020122 [Brassica cretica]